MENYKLIALLVIVIWLFIVGSEIGSFLDRKIDKKKIVEKACPPHRWLSKEQIGMPGTWFIRCQRCRVLPGWENKEK